MHFMIYLVLDSKRFPNAISIFWSQKKTSFTNTEPPKYKANCKEIKTAQKIALLTSNFLGSCSNNAVLKRPQTSISYKNPCNPRKKSWVWRLAGFFLDLQITTSESLRSHDFFGYIWVEAWDSKATLVGGFNPIEKYARHIGSFPQVGMNIINIWNHQPTSYSRMLIRYHFHNLFHLLLRCLETKIQKNLPNGGEHFCDLTYGRIRKKTHQTKL